MSMTCEFFSKLNNEYRVKKSSIKSFKKKEILTQRSIENESFMSGLGMG